MGSSDEAAKEAMRVKLRAATAQARDGVHREGRTVPRWSPQDIEAIVETLHVPQEEKRDGDQPNNGNPGINGTEGVEEERRSLLRGGGDDGDGTTSAGKGSAVTVKNGERGKASAEEARGVLRAKTNSHVHNPLFASSSSSSSYSNELSTPLPTSKSKTKTWTKARRISFYGGKKRRPIREDVGHI